MPFHLDATPVDRRRRGLVFSLAALPSAGLLSACGGGGGNAHLRVANASIAYSTADVQFGDDVKLSALAAQTTSDYIDMDTSRSTDLRIKSGGSVLAETSVDAGDDDHFSAIFNGGSSGYTIDVINENSSAANSGEASLRAFNASTATTLDVYLTGPNTDLSSVAPSISAAAQSTLTGFATIDAATYRVRITTGGASSEIRLDTALELSSTSAAALVIYPSQSGLLVNAVLLPEKSGFVALNNPKARLRFVNALAADVEMTPLLDGNTTGSNIAAHTATGYQLINKGQRQVGAKVGGANHQTESALHSATDTTCALYGDSASPKLLVLTDNTSPPTSAINVRMRLVNLVDGGATLSLSVNQGSSSLSAAPGAASDYLQFAADTVRLDALDSSGQTVATIGSVQLVGGAVYTLFIIANGSDAQALLRRDL